MTAETVDFVPQPEFHGACCVHETTLEKDYRDGAYGPSYERCKKCGLTSNPWSDNYVGRQ